MASYSVKILRVEEYQYEVEAVSLTVAQARAEELCHEKMEGDAYPNAVGGSITLAEAVTEIREIAG